MVKETKAGRGVRLVPVAVAGVLAACAFTATPPPATTPATPEGQSATAEGQPTSSPTPTTPAEPIPSASEAAAAVPDGVLAPDSIAQVVTTDLVVRSLPEVSDASVIHATQLDEPTLLFIADGPIAANGYDWYQVKPFGMHYLDFMQGPPPFGWVAAASREGEPWIAPAAIDCPEPQLEAILEMSGVARLACYRGQELTLSGAFGGCFVADPTVIEPAWLTSTGCELVPADPRWRGVVPNPGGLAMRMNGSVGLPHDQPDALITVTGHFDDPAATACDLVEGLDPQLYRTAPSDRADAILGCRTEFVVTGVERLGP